MFWKKSAKPSDQTISGKFQLGGPDVPASPLSGSSTLIPSNSDGTSLLAANGSSKENSKGAPPPPLSGLSPMLPSSAVANKDVGVRYVVPRGYKVSSSTFIQGLVRVDGELGGRSIAASVVEISATGVVSAPLEAGSLIVGGQLNAPADVRGCIEVRSSAVVSGPMVSAELVVEPGARVASSRLQVG